MCVYDRAISLLKCAQDYQKLYYVFELWDVFGSEHAPTKKMEGSWYWFDFT